MSDRTEQILQLIEPIYEDAPPYGIVNEALSMNALVQQKSGTDPVELGKAAPTGDGVSALFLQNEVIADDQAGRDKLLNQHIFRDNIKAPVRVGHTCTAIRAKRVRVESDTWIDSANLNGATAINTEITVKNGKFTVAGANDVVAGRLELQLTPLVAANVFRLEIVLTN